MSGTDGARRKVVELLVSVPLELTDAVNLLMTHKAEPFKYVKLKAAVPFTPVVTVAGTLPPSEF